MPAALYRPLPSNSPWLTPGITERLRALFAQRKLSYTGLAELLNQEFGTRFNGKAVSEKLGRLGLLDDHPERAKADTYAPITLPAVAGRYSYRGGRLWLDGEPAEVRA